MSNFSRANCSIYSGELIFFELKTAKTVKAAIREAIGQLLEYNHYPNTNKANKLIIVTKSEPSESDIQYLSTLRTKYNLPVYYQYFDIKNSKLSEEY